MEDNITPQEGTNPEVEVLEETVVEETTETPEEEAPIVTEETVPKSQFNQVLARAKKAEEALKKAAPATNITKSSSVSSEEIDAKILKVQKGYSDDLINELKAVAKARGTTILNADSDPIFLAIKSEHDTRTKAEKAKLGASKGSGSVKREKSFDSPDLTDEEHRQLWKDRNSK